MLLHIRDMFLLVGCYVTWTFNEHYLYFFNEQVYYDMQYLHLYWLNRFCTIFCIPWLLWHAPLTLEAQLAGAVEYADCISTEGQNPHFKCPGYDIKLQLMVRLSVLELWEMWSTSSLLLLQGSHWPGVVISVGILSIGQIKLFNHLPVCK